MNTIDIVILVFLLIGAYTGYRRGLLMEIISLSGFFIAIIAGIKLLDWGIVFLSNYIIGYDHLLPILAFAIIFIGLIILITYLGKTIKKILDMTLLGSLDDIAGAVMSAVKWALFISIFLWIYESFGGQIDEELTTTSYLYGPISTFAPGIFRVFSGLFPHIMDYFDQSKDLINQHNNSA